MLAGLAGLAQAACAAGIPDRQAGPAGRWLAEDIGGRGVMDDARTVLELGSDGSVSGIGGCNRMAGQALIKGPAIRFRPLASTMMACPDAQMDQERRFHDALQATRSWSIDPATGKLTFADDTGKPVIVFTPM